MQGHQTSHPIVCRTSWAFSDSKLDSGDAHKETWGTRTMINFTAPLFACASSVFCQVSYCVCEREDSLSPESCRGTKGRPKKIFISGKDER